MEEPRRERAKRHQEAKLEEPGAAGPPVHPVPPRETGSPAGGRPLAARRRRVHRDILAGQPRPLIDREVERAAAVEQLIRPDVRLLTVTGPPGVGKTHLALAVAADVAPHFPDGVASVDFSPVREPELVPGAIAQALLIREAPDRPLLESLKASLRHRRILLVLDNFEQLLPASTALAELLASCRGLKALVTSRSALQLRWEHLLPLLPLELPARGRPLTPAELARYPAIVLFVEQARAVHPLFRLASHNAWAVAEICARLDGLPLAIELAAAHSYALSPPEILERLHRRLDLPAEGPRDLPPRHRTLRAALDWSYHLLLPGEQSLFGRLGVFAGGCTLEAVEAVCGTASPDAVGGLISLVAKSLLRREEQPDGRARFRMLETVREYALERLEASGGEAGPARRSHAAYYLTMAEEGEPELWGTGQAAWAARLDAELDNLRAAMAWCAGPGGDPELAVRFAGALSHFWDLRGQLSEGRRWIPALLAASPRRTADRVKALSALAFLALLQGDAPGMLVPLLEAHDLARELEDRSLLAFSLTGLGFHAHLVGDDAEAATLLEKGLALAREVEDGITASTALFGLAILAWGAGERERAVALQEESLALSRRRGDLWASAHSLFVLGRWEMEMEGPARGESHLQESLFLRLQLGDRRGVAACLSELGIAAGRGEQWERAARLLGAGETLRESAGGTPLDWQGDPRPVVKEAQARLGEGNFAAAWGWGRALGMEEAAAYALADREPGRSTAPAGRQRDAELALLTRREREIAALVAEGLSSTEIAGRLVISVRTAENHVNHILHKLRLSSRRELAGWAARHGLAGREPENRPGED
jgi:predicted ATPase/DNA-binding CsgD family transcriptional regulator